MTTHYDWRYLYAVIHIKQLEFDKHPNIEKDSGHLTVARINWCTISQSVLHRKQPLLTESTRV